MTTTKLASVLLLLLCSAAVHAKTDAKCGTGGGADNWDKCDGLCCQRASNDYEVRDLEWDGTVSACCSDNFASGCPTGMECCSPGNSANNPKSRDDQRYCYYSDSISSACCKFQVYDFADGDKKKPGATVYNPILDKCCEGAMIWEDYYNDDPSSKGATGNVGGSWNGIVPVGESCFWTADSPSIRAQCKSDSDCSVGDPAVEGKCCRRPQNTDLGETAAAYSTVYGKCYDPEIQGCCGGVDSEVEAEAGGDDAKTEYMAELYNLETEKCCALQHSVIEIDARCSCQTDEQCASEGTGSTCCQRAWIADSVRSALTCADTCGTLGSHSAPAGCMGVCTIPRLEDVCFDETCNYFLDNDDSADDGILSDQPDARCCHSADESVIQPQAYRAHSHVCCPQGVDYSASVIVLAQEGDLHAGSTRCRCMADSDCPSAQKCCGRMFTEDGTRWGTCYDAATESCCATHEDEDSEIYKTETSVCCPLNGVQSSYAQCRCGGDSQCPTGGVCCVDAETASSRGWLATKCDAEDYTLCPGTCTWGEVNECCDNQHMAEGPYGVSRCNKKYEKCCDGSCCNKFTESCKKGKIQQGVHPDPWNYDVEQRLCTFIEHRTPTITFNAFVFPAFLTLIALILIGLSVVRGLDSGATPTILKFVVIGLAVFTGVMCCLLLWSPVWKYGFVVVIANAILLGALSMDTNRARVLAGLVILTSFLYLVDPIGGNSVLTMDGAAVVHMSEDSAPRGLQSAIMYMHKRYEGSLTPYPFEGCTKFYGYFEEDPELEDYRHENWARSTRSMCGAGWMHTIAIISGLIIVFQSLLVVLGLILLPNSQSNGAVSIAPAPKVDST